LFESLITGIPTSIKNPINEDHKRKSCNAISIKVLDSSLYMIELQGLKENNIILTIQND